VSCEQERGDSSQPSPHRPSGQWAVLDSAQRSGREAKWQQTKAIVRALSLEFEFLT
jgi:hypothetical protein